MRIDVTREAMRLLRSPELNTRPLWEAIEQLRTNPTPPDSIVLPEERGMREMHVRVGQRGYWLQWEIKQDRGETVVRVAIIEEN
jgi:hypothetical protein